LLGLDKMVANQSRIYKNFWISMMHLNDCNQ